MHKDSGEWALFLRRFHSYLANPQNIPRLTPLGSTLETGPGTLSAYPSRIAGGPDSSLMVGRSIVPREALARGVSDSVHSRYRLVVPKIFTREEEITV